MDRDSIIQGISEYVGKEILRDPRKKITPDQSLIQSGWVDSFNLVSLGMFVEDTYGVRLDDTELNADTFDTSAQLADLILSRLA
jgi:acyl carrier protein